MGAMRTLPLLLLVLLCGCEAQLRARGSQPVSSWPDFQAVETGEPAYRVWVVVPWLKVNTYPMPNETQQPLLQFTGDREGLKRGLGQMTMLAAPDRFHDGEPITFFEDKVLWSDQLRARDRRLFTFWLRENNRSVPTRYDENLKKVEPFAHAVEEISGAAGYKIPARRAINIGAQVLRELSKDWLILKWDCAWGHVLKQAEARWKGSGPQTVMLKTRLETKERVGDKPVALVDVLFVLQRLAVPTPKGVK